MSKPVILTGLRANNDLHIGNYFGALLPLIDMAKNKADEYQINLFVPDLHSITTPIDYKSLQSQIMNNLKIFVAAGLPLENENVYVYQQSYIPAHSELTLILDCFTGMGEMGRMTQYKDKSAKLGEDRVSVGLFNYPVLMAADILLYGAEYIPVGDDQTQHLEIVRDIAERMNKKFGGLFTVPKPVKEQHKFFDKDQGLRIKDLVDPSKKMSKSDESDKGIIFMGDSPDVAKAKIMAAATDSLGKIDFDPDKQPGISNLIQIYALLENKAVEEITKEFAGQTQYGPFKEKVAEAVGNFLSDFQTKLAKVDESSIDDKLQSSEKAMSEVANQTLEKVQNAVGLR